MMDIFLVIAATMAAIALVGGPSAVTSAVRGNKAKHRETETETAP